MRYDDRVHTMFVTPNGIRWVVLVNSPHIEMLNRLIKGYVKENEYVGSR